MNKIKKIWRHYPDECYICGSSVEVFTYEDSEEGWVYDGDEVRCLGEDCKAVGSITVYDEDDVSMSMDEESSEYYNEI